MTKAPEDPVVFEATTTLREWHSTWLSLYLDDQTELFERIESILTSVIDLRAELVAALKAHSDSEAQDTAGKDQQIVELKSKIVAKLDFGNKLLNLDLIPRDANFELVDPKKVSPIKLYQLYAEASQNNPYGIRNGFSTASQVSGSSESHTSYNPIQLSFHLQMSIKNYSLASLPPDELVEIYFSVVDATSNNSGVNTNAPVPNRPLTDKFLVQIKNDKLTCGVPNTIFTNLGPLHNRDACLHVQVYRLGKMMLMDGTKTTFGRQQSGHGIQQSATNQDGSMTSINSANKYTPNGLTRGIHSSASLVNTPISRYRRPFGATMVHLKDITKNPNYKETSFNLKINASNESEFSQLNDTYQKRNLSLKVSQNLPNVQLEISMKFIICSPESLSKLSTLQPYCLTEKRGFSDIVMPGDFKNDLYFTLESAEFEKGGKSISKNIEASISLRNRTGLAINECISPGSNCDNVTCHKSCVFYHSNTPKWNEVIKINVPLAEFDSSHIRIEFRHCSTKEPDKVFHLGFAFLPLSDEDGTVIADGSHELYLYKCDPQFWEDESLDLSKYTSLPYGPAAKLPTNTRPVTQHNFNHSSREIVTVNTFLLSTKLTQNSNLLNLLRWRELIKRDKKEFEEALKKTLDLKGEEIVKFLQDILDTLFDTFSLFADSENDCSGCSGWIFKVLIHIFLLLEEPKYRHFQQVLDTYASAHFSATLVYKGLLVGVKQCLESSPIVSFHPRIQGCFKSLKYIFQFIVQSRLLYLKATGQKMSDGLFLDDLRQLFNLFDVMLSKHDTKLIPIQITFLESFPETLEQLIKVISEEELAQVVTSLAGSVGFALPPPLAKAKLIFMKKTASSALIKKQDIRLQITENFCRQLDYYITHPGELELCYEVLEILIVKIHDYHWPSIYRLYQLTAKTKLHKMCIDSSSIMTVGEINQSFQDNLLQADQLELAIRSVCKELEPFVNILDPLLQLLDKLDFDSRHRPIGQKLCTCVLTIFKLMGKSSFEQFLKKREIDYSKLCNLFRSFRAVYDRDWSIMQLTSHFILENPINEIMKDVKPRVETRLSINQQLKSYIELLVDFITHPTLQLELFSERKKSHVLGVFGDLRIMFCAQLIRFWSNLKQNSICDLIPTSTQSFLDAALLPNNDIQCKIMPVFWDMIDAEEHCKASTKQFEQCFIDNLDLFLNLDRGNQMFVENFETILRRLIQEKSPSWGSRGLKVINSLTRLMRLLIAYRQSMSSSEGRGKQMSCLVDLLNFYKEQDRVDLHLKYLFRLSDMHLEVENHVEAALTLKLYTDELKFCDRNLSPLEGYRLERQEWRRKEVLFLRIIDYFDKAKCWEETVPMCKELASFYEIFLNDYEKVSSTLKKWAQFLDKILKMHRPEREYFRVEFLGSDLPDYVRGKEFIYRGGEYERLPAFMQRMNAEFPDAKVLNAQSKYALAKDCAGQYMVISNVKPVPLIQENGRNINDKIIQYYLNNRLDTFSYDVPIIRGGSGESASEVDVKNLWVGRYMLKSKKALPDIVPWSEVVSQEYIEINPLENAIERISSKNLELIRLIESYKNEPGKQISPLTMRLQGVLEAAVNGGPAVFVNAFLKRQPVATEAVEYEPKLLARLRDLIEQQFTILDKGLTLHAKLAPPNVKPLHDRLVDRWSAMRMTLLDESNQLADNTYEQLTNHHIRDCAPRADNNDDNQVPNSESSVVDEIDGHDMNGNFYGKIDDETYSQPVVPRLSKFHPSISNGSRSELSSPSRYYNSSTSSSLSTLAFLNHLPVYHQQISLTPTKDPSLHQIESLSYLKNNDLCAKAARKLVYDTESGNMALRDKKDDAPPLPPRSFVPNDKQKARTAMNRSPYLSSRTSSPSENGSILATRNFASLSLSDANRIVEALDQEPVQTARAPLSQSDLTKMMKPILQPTAQQVVNTEPPPLPQRARTFTPQTKQPANEG